MTYFSVTIYLQRNSKQQFTKHFYSFFCYISAITVPAFALFTFYRTNKLGLGKPQEQKALELHLQKLKDDKEKERNAMKKKMEEREKNKGNAVAMGTALNGFSGD